MGYLWGFIIVMLWATTIGAVLGFAKYMIDLSDPYPSARAIGVLKKYLKELKEDASTDMSIDTGTKKALGVKGRDVVLKFGDIHIPLSEDEGKILTIHLLTVYPEMEDSGYEPIFEKQKRDLDYYAKHDGGPVWC